MRSRRPPAHPSRRAAAVLDGLAHVLGNIERTGAVGGCQDQRELVAMIARHQVARTADDGGKGATDLLQHFVAGLAAVLAG